jgi:LPXTG-motif cell wall-anchored protein
MTGNLATTGSDAATSVFLAMGGLLAAAIGFVLVRRRRVS